MRRLAPVLLVSLILTSAVCPSTEPPEEDVYEGAVISELVPANGSVDVLATSTLYVRFVTAADEATAELTTAAGEDVGTAVALSDDGLELKVDPFIPLQASTDYVWVVTFAPSSVGTIEASFRTGPHGAPVEVDASGLVGTTWRIEVETGDLTEPSGAAAIVASYLTSSPILFGIMEGSSFAPDDQPGLYLLGSLGDIEDGVITQTRCRGSAHLSAGDDFELGTEDDNPGSWEDPFLQMGPYHLPLQIAGALVGIYDLDLRWTVHPELVDMESGTFSGIVDTRWLDDLVPGEGGAGTVCELLAAVELPCSECPEGDPGPFCLRLEAEGLSASLVPDVVLQEQDCADVIGLFVDAGECAEDAADFDPDGDGSYALCPQWTAR